MHQKAPTSKTLNELSHNFLFRNHTIFKSLNLNLKKKNYLKNASACTVRQNTAACVIWNKLLDPFEFIYTYSFLKNLRDERSHGHADRQAKHYRRCLILDLKPMQELFMRNLITKNINCIAIHVLQNHA